MINPDNGHGAADGMGGSDEESHLMSSAIDTSSSYPHSMTEIADDESPLNGSQVNDSLSASRTADTEPPTGNGFLEQWSAFAEETVNDLEAVCRAGLSPQERATLIKFSLKLLSFSAINATPDTFVNNPEIEQEIVAMCENLELPDFMK